MNAANPLVVTVCAGSWVAEGGADRVYMRGHGAFLPHDRHGTA